MTDWLMSITGVATTFLAGIVVGALLTQWRTAARARRASTKRGAPPMLWDIHSVLNAMNKLALTAERGRPVDPSLIYLLSDYLLHSALIQREDGWADRDSLENWLLAHVRVVADHRGQTMLPAVTVQMREDVRRIHAKQLLRQLLWFLQKAPAVDRIHINVFGTKGQDRMVRIRVEVEGDRVDLGKLSEDGSSPSSWHMEAGLSTCELRAAFETGPA